MKLSRINLSGKLTVALCLTLLLSPRLASVDAQQARPNQQNNGNGNQGNGNQGNGNQGNGNQGNGKNDQDEDNDVESKIDADIQGPERSVIHNAMRGLRREDRENVMLLGADGQIYANKTWLKGAACVPQRIGDNLYQDPTGRQFPLSTPTSKPTENSPTDGNDTSQANSRIGAATPFQTSRPNVFTGATYPNSGPYRRVYSKLPKSYNAEDLAWNYDDTAPGYSYEDGYVTLPSNQVPRVHPNVQEVTHATTDQNGQSVYRKDTACIYMGGWSAGFNDSDANHTYQSYLSADAGVQHDNGININPLGLTHPPTRDSWVMLMLISRISPLDPSLSNTYQTNPDGTLALLPYKIRLVPNQQVGMNFYISHAGGRTYLNLNVFGHAKKYDTGYDLGTHNWSMSCDVTDTAPGDPWHVDGTGVVLKRMTTIAQNGGNNFRSCSIVKNVQWSNCKICITGGTPALWDQNSFGGQEYYPDRNHVHVDGFSYSGETDAVKLCGRR